MNAKKFDSELTNEADFKAWMQNYQHEMYKLRCQHLKIIEGKNYEVEGTANLEDVDRKLSQSMLKIAQAREEAKTEEPPKSKN